MVGRDQRRLTRSGCQLSDEYSQISDVVEGVLVDYAGLVHGPVDECCFAVDEGAGDGAEVAAVAGDAAVVAHHPEVANGDDAFGLGALVAEAVGNVGLADDKVVDVDGAVVDADGVAGEGNHALDVTLGVVAGIEEDHDVAAVDGLEAIGELVDEEAILILQAREHAGAFHADGLVEEQDDEERHGDGDEDVARPGAPAGGLCGGVDRGLRNEGFAGAELGRGGGGACNSFRGRVGLRCGWLVGFVVRLGLFWMGHVLRASVAGGAENEPVQSGFYEIRRSRAGLSVRGPGCGEFRLGGGRRGDGGGVGEAEAGDEVFVVDPVGAPGVDNDFGEFGDGDFGFVVDGPAMVAVVVSEDGEDHGTGLAHDDGDVVADGVKRAGFAGDGGAGFAGVDGLEVTRDGLAVELIFEHVEGDGADGAIGVVGSREERAERGVGADLVEIAEADGFHEVGHLAGSGLTEAEFGLVGGHGARGGQHDLLVKVGVGETKGLEAGVDGVYAEAVDG